LQKNNFLNLYLQIAVLFGSVIIGGLLVEFFKKSSGLKLLLSFSGGFLLTIIFTHILPETYGHFGKSTGVFILCGFLLQIILEYFSKGVEHGHSHVHGVGKAFPLVLFVSLSIHAFLEAIPIVDAHGHSHGHSHGESNLLWGVFLHKIPVAIALLTVFKASDFPNFKAWIYTALFGLMAPLGLVFGDYMTTHFNLDTDWILAVAMGMFLHVSTTIIFESSEGHKLNLIKLIAIVLGFGLGILVG
jgi:zinc transporter ZupT